MSLIAVSNRHGIMLIAYETTIVMIERDHFHELFQFSLDRPIGTLSDIKPKYYKVSEATL